MINFANTFGFKTPTPIGRFVETSFLFFYIIDKDSLSDNGRTNPPPTNITNLFISKLHIIR